jgi:hypothetical protein
MTQSAERDDLLKRIDELLWEDAYADDVRLMATISLELGEVLRDNLDNLQRAALDAAKAYWHGDGRNEEDRLAFVEQVGTRRDKDVRNGTSRTPERLRESGSLGCAQHQYRIIWLCRRVLGGDRGWRGSSHRPRP